MEIGAANILDWILYFLLILLRILATFALSPVFGRAMPSIAKIVLSLAVSYIVLCMVPPEAPAEYAFFIEFVVAAMKEIILGLIFGFMINMFMSAVYISGQIIDLQMGFSFAQVYNPITGNQSPISGTLLNILIVILFFTNDMHLRLFQMLHYTFTILPPGRVVFNTDIVKLAVSAFIFVFEMGFQIALPILIASLITEVLLGVIMKSVPNVNFFAIGFPVKIIMGFLIFMSLIPVISSVSVNLFDEMFTAIQKIFEELGGVQIG